MWEYSLIEPTRSEIRARRVLHLAEQQLEGDAGLHPRDRRRQDGDGNPRREALESPAVIPVATKVGASRQAPPPAVPPASR